MCVKYRKRGDWFVFANAYVNHIALHTFTHAATHTCNQLLPNSSGMEEENELKKNVIV